MDSTFFGLALLATLNPKLLGVDLLLLENRRPKMMFACFLLGAIGLSVTIGVLDVLVFQVGTVRDQGSISAGFELVAGGALLAVGALVATGRLRGRQKQEVPAAGAAPSET